MKIQEERNNVDDWLKVIADYLLTRDDIKSSLEKENKSLEECGRYILQEARKKGSFVAMSDKEVFGLAVHYYDEDNLKIGKTINHAHVKKSEDTVESKPAQEEKTVEKVDIEKIVEKRVQERLAKIKKAEKEEKEKRKAERKAKKQKVDQVSLFDL